MRTSDIVIRYGGDEFLIVLPETNASDLRKITGNVKRKVKGWSEKIDIGFPVSLSIGGYTLNPNRKGGVDKVLKEADKRLYKDKRRRKTQHCPVRFLRARVLSYPNAFCRVSRGSFILDSR